MYVVYETACLYVRLSIRLSFTPQTMTAVTVTATATAAATQLNYLWHEKS